MFEKIVHLVVLPIQFNKQAPKILCGSIMRRFFGAALSGMSYSPFMDSL